MSNEISTNEQPASFPATVVSINDPYTVAINRGSSHGIRHGQKFLVYGLSDEEIIDPETNQSLGRLEIVRGTGAVIHVQEKLATIETSRRSKKNRTITRSSKQRGVFSLYPDQGDTVETIEGEETYVAFDDPKVGDKARPI